MNPSHITTNVAPPPGWVRSVLVFGGTFDPPHRGHIDLPERVRVELGADWLLYVPAWRSPHKSGAPTATPDDRVAMLAAAIESSPFASISTLELARPDVPSYTIDTLGRLAQELPEASFRLLIGADQAAAFHRWREPRRVIELAEPVVMLRRPRESAEALIQSMRGAGPPPAGWSDDEIEAWRSRVVNVPLIDAEATGLRHLLGEHGVCHELVRRCLPDPVRRVIVERHIYGVQLRSQRART